MRNSVPITQFKKKDLITSEARALPAATILYHFLFLQSNHYPELLGFFPVLYPCTYKQCVINTLVCVSWYTNASSFIHA